MALVGAVEVASGIAIEVAELLGAGDVVGLDAVAIETLHARRGGARLRRLCSRSRAHLLAALAGLDMCFWSAPRYLSTERAF